MDNKKIVKKYFNKYFKQHYLEEDSHEFKSLVRILNKANKPVKKLTIPVVSNSLPNDVKCMLVESEYRLQQAIDIFNGTTNLDSTKEDKYSKMVECANSINEYLKGNDC